MRTALAPSFVALTWSNLAAQSAEQLTPAANPSARPVGAALVGFIGSTWGEPACLGVVLAGFLIQAWIVFGSEVRSLQRLPAPAV